MQVRDLVRALGGGKRVAQTRSVSPQAVSHWCSANDVPAEHYLPLWRMALEAGLPWEPPGAAELRPLLSAKSAEAA
jgi:hypothetical protein